MADGPAVRLEGVWKGYASPEGKVAFAFRPWEVPGGAQVAITGDSGSGKTTLLHLIAGIVVPDRGRVEVLGLDLGALPEAARDRFRGSRIGLVFQSLNLFQHLTALENLLAAPLLAGKASAEDRGRARALLARVGLEGRASHRPSEMSLGEQQRVAIARALMNRPALLLADEPTGSLDARRGDELLRLLRSSAEEAGATLLVVTHDEAVVRALPQSVRMQDLYAPAAGPP